MADDPVTLIPDALYAGDTWFFELAYADYPASTWSLVVYFSSPGGAFSATGLANGTAHRFTVAATTTADYEPGEYEYQIRAEHSSDGRVFTVGRGSICVDPPLSVQGDHRHRVKRILDAIDAVIENRANNDHLSVSISGRSISKMGVDELRGFRAWYADQWSRLNAERRSDAFGTSRRQQYKAKFL